MADSSSVIQRLSAAVDLYRGDFLQDLDGDAWAFLRREELRKLCANALLKKARLEETIEDLSAATSSYMHLLDLQPYHDAAHVGLMASLAKTGDRAGALRHFDEMSARYSEGLGVSPGQAANDLANAIREGRTA